MPPVTCQPETSTDACARIHNGDKLFVLIAGSGIEVDLPKLKIQFAGPLDPSQQLRSQQHVVTLSRRVQRVDRQDVLARSEQRQKRREIEVGKVRCFGDDELATEFHETSPVTFSRHTC